MDNPRLQYLHEKTLSLPMEPGVYIMHDKSGKVIYVGKAKKLKNKPKSGEEVTAFIFHPPLSAIL